MFDIAVIGAGASGITAAIAAKNKNEKLSIAVFDSMNRIGKKILATGNGRCNLSNRHALEHEYYNKNFALTALEKYNVEYTVDFFNSLGLFTYEDEEGRIYPLSNSAASVLDALRFECDRLGITVFTDEKIDTVKVKNDGTFVINGRFLSKKVIISCGGKASPSQGSDGSGFELLRSLGHTIIKPLPALVQLTSDNKIIKSFKGLRSKGNMKLFAGENQIGTASGEILFTEYGLSGIASMDAQRILCDYLSKEKCSVVIDFFPTLTQGEIKSAIIERAERNPKLKCENLLSGLVPKKIGQGFIKCIYIKNDAPASVIGDNEADRLATLMKNFRIFLTGSKGFESAQVTRGGADTSQFSQDSMESKLVKNLYCAGEILNIDGGCGGFNLQWAFSSGFCAGENACRFNVEV
ncbi:MAG: aminoacetone oxidase family FAD-binding enzyme [Clostridia bacterium]|nr:aminoacetone oxidase family FAD-binding enzyme [Clostridia bacterium]